MNIQVIAEHSVDLDLLPEKANILDAGCRGFQFTDYLRNKGHYVLALDVDSLGREDYFNAPLTADGRMVSIKRSSDPQATSICEGKDFHSVTIQELCNLQDILMFDLIKLDIELSEYEVIMSMNRPYTKQLSVEFHTHCGQTDKQVQECVDKLHSLGYKTIQHEKTRRHGLAPNWWDSLFIL